MLSRQEKADATYVRQGDYFQSFSELLMDYIAEKGCRSNERFIIAPICTGISPMSKISHRCSIAELMIARTSDHDYANEVMVPHR